MATAPTIAPYTRNNTNVSCILAALTERHHDVHKAAAVIIQDRQVLLTRSHGKTVFVPPGGKLEDGEDERDALIRELGEELGIATEREDLAPIGTFYMEVGYIMLHDVIPQLKADDLID